MPITAKEAWEATNPDMPEEERKASAERIMAGVAANDAYLNSRSEVEQAIALSKGGQVAEPHDVREAAAQSKGSEVATLGHDVESTAVEIGRELSDDEKKELTAIKARLDELTGGKS